MSCSDCWLCLPVSGLSSCAARRPRSSFVALDGSLSLYAGRHVWWDGFRQEKALAASGSRHSRSSGRFVAGFRGKTNQTTTASLEKAQLPKIPFWVYNIS